MNEAESLLVAITALIGIACGISVQSKLGITMGSMQSLIKGSAVKYVERPGRRTNFYLYLIVALMALTMIGTSLTTNLTNILLFVLFNLLSVTYFLCYFVLLEPKDKVE